MTEIITFTLPGTPAAKGRPRFTGNGRTYTDAKTKAAEQSILAAYLVAGGSKRQPHNGPVEVDLTASFLAPQSWPKWKTRLAEVWPHLSRPDLDNLVKILDGLNGRAWIDDSQITRITARKHYGTTASTTVVLTFHPAPSKGTTK